MPTRDEIELSFYEQFVFARNLEPYPVQEKAWGHIFAGQSVLVTVPTGTGKTLIAKAAIHKAVASGQTAIYTTPLRALTEEKYRELCEDFGEDRVGFATGDYKVNPQAPLQVIVAEILWNRIFGDRVNAPADVVIMDEAHYFNEPERGYVWEQSIIGLDPRSQLVLLSATVGEAGSFCSWVYACRKEELQLVEGTERRVPLYHEFREQYLIEVVKELWKSGDYPAIVFGFGREQCFERARLLKSCPRFTTDEEKARIEAFIAPFISDRGIGKDLRALLVHGIGIHHAGILPKYKQLVEQLTLERLIKFVVSTETIAAGINLPAKRVIFPELRKYIRKKARLVTSAEYHQMSGRAGRPQFDTEGIAITLAPEAVVQEIRKEVKEAEKSRRNFDENQIRRKHFALARSEAQRNQDVTWDVEEHRKIVEGTAAPLRSQTKISASMVLAIGLPDLAVEVLPAQEIVEKEAAERRAREEQERIAREAAEAEREARAAEKAAAALANVDGEPERRVIVPRIDLQKIEEKKKEEPPPPIPESQLPASLHLNIKTVIDHLLLPLRDKWDAHKRLAMVTANLRAMGVVDEHGQQVGGRLVSELRGCDGLFVNYCLVTTPLDYPLARALVEYLVDHDVIQRALGRKVEEERKLWIKNRLRERRRDEPQVSWEDVEEEHARKFPRELTPIEEVHARFLAELPHPELHGGKVAKAIWARMEDAQMGFYDLVEQEQLQTEEGSLFSYLIRVMKFARMLKDATSLDEFAVVERGVRGCLAEIDPRVLDE